jgi:dTMP kinase
MPQAGVQYVPGGVFLVLEGLDGAGKTTQTSRLAERLQNTGYAVVRLKEPTEGVWGQKLRQLIQQGRQGVSQETELEWFLADRREDVQYNIQPALQQGQIVILDRYYYSTMAYQGALGFDPEAIRQQNETFAPLPDRLFLLEIAPVQGLQRVAHTRSPDHFERREYLERVAALFARMDFPYLRRIPATLSPEAIHAQIWQEVQNVLAQRQPRLTHCT